MYVSSTDDRGVVDAETRLYFTQKGSRVLARYAGGLVKRGCLVGTISESELVFRYTQLEDSSEIHGGRSTCEVQWSEEAGLRVSEHFTWSTRNGSGTNVFAEVRRTVFQPNVVRNTAAPAQRVSSLPRSGALHCDVLGLTEEVSAGFSKSFGSTVGLISSFLYSTTLVSWPFCLFLCI